MLNWGLIGGGDGSQIGPAHRLGAAIDGKYRFVACALDADPIRGREFGVSLGVDISRSYGDWREMLAEESLRSSDRLDLVTIATPNVTHYEIARSFLGSGFDVLCEKPLTMTVDESEDLVRICREHDRICAVNYGYSGYAMVRQMRSMVLGSELGDIRVVVAEFSHGHHSDASDADNPRIRWRYDSSQAGVSSIVADCGIHALHMAHYVTGCAIERISADFASTVSSRELEDDAYLAFRMEGGIVGRCWTSAVALGRQHGLTLQVFGERGGLRWSQEQPNQLYWTPLDGVTRTLERGSVGLSSAASRASRVTVGCTEGMPLAFANVYLDIAELLEARKAGRSPDELACSVPMVEDGLRSVALVHASVESSGKGGEWCDAVPPLLSGSSS